MNFVFVCFRTWCVSKQVEGRKKKKKEKIIDQLDKNLFAAKYLAESFLIFVSVIFLKISYLKKIYLIIVNHILTG